jgi:hypothetical protein
MGEKKYAECLELLITGFFFFCMKEQNFVKQRKRKKEKALSQKG